MTIDRARDYVDNVYLQVKHERLARYIRMRDELAAKASAIKPQEPRGLFAWMVRGDYKRVRYEYERRRSDYDVACWALNAANEVWERSPPIEDLDAIAARLNAINPQILQIAIESLAKEKDQEERRRQNKQQEAMRKESKRRREDTLQELTERQCHEYRLMIPDIDSPCDFTYRDETEALLIGQMEMVPEEVYAEATRDNGRTSLLYPWRDDMSRYFGRTCWFGYNDQDVFYFKPVLGSKPPIVPGAASANRYLTERATEFEHSEEQQPSLPANFSHDRGQGLGL